LWAGKKIRHKHRGENKMKKLISLTLLSAVAMLAAPKTQNSTTTATKKVHKKHHHSKKAATKTASVAPAK
jgi:uncharacterized lipoprotein YajG